MAAEYTSAMDTYTQAMDLAIKKGLTADDGLRVVGDRVDAKLAACNRTTIENLKKEVAKISTDATIAEATRQRFVDFWTNYLDIRSYVEKPRGNYSTYRTKYLELSDKHSQLTASLELLLGIKVADE